MTRYWLSLIQDVLNTPAILGRPLKDRIMFGTDQPYLLSDGWRRLGQFHRVLASKGERVRVEFAEEEVRKLLEGNAGKILGL